MDFLRYRSCCPVIFQGKATQIPNIIVEILDEADICKGSSFIEWRLLPLQEVSLRGMR